MFSGREPPILIALYALILLLSPAFAKAQGREPLPADLAAPNCQLQSGGESTILAVAGPQTLRLADGRFVRLAEILVPVGVAAGFDPSAAAVSYLRQTAIGRKAEVKFGGTQRDRYGVYTGHVFVSGESPLWLQRGLVSSGFAAAIPQADNHACARQLLAYEDEARKENRGHWGLALFKVFQASDPRPILNLVQTYQIVEGTVDHASESGGRITLHFENERKYGFTATLEPAALKKLGGHENADAWAKLPLRIRGWVDRKKGPAISVGLAEQVEFLPKRGNGANAAQPQR